MDDYFTEKLNEFVINQLKSFGAPFERIEGSLCIRFDMENEKCFELNADYARTSEIPPRTSGCLKSNVGDFIRKHYVGDRRGKLCGLVKIYNGEQYVSVDLNAEYDGVERDVAKKKKRRNMTSSVDVQKFGPNEQVDCKICNLSLNAQAMQHHLYDRHFDNIGSNCKAYIRHYETGKKYRCTVCDFSSDRNKSVHVHVRRLHMLNKRYECPLCRTSMPNVHKMHEHIRQHFAVLTKYLGFDVLRGAKNVVDL
ncbi:unnamed protein product [Dimorphilus gyrociliatus]|uniref:C2H2-type domain-containing protein n=1 Tax=Dimorphilus gyrociliatus TaxID=2664684 RepID=A0A7I8W905_9ANNE|nr:unnamed protein product [Dimorphilus gyrociliatus]